MKNTKIQVLAALSLAVAGASCSKEIAAGVFVDRAFTPLIRPEATVLASINLEKLKTSPLYQKHKNELNLPILDEATERFGLDPRRDLTQLLYVSDAQKFYILARGTFKGDTVKQKVRTLGLRSSSYRNVDLLGDGQNAFALLKGPVALMGTAAALHEAIDTEASGRGEVPEEMANRLRALPKDDQVWIISRDGLPFVSAPMRNDVQSALSNFVGSVKSASASLRLDTGVHLQASLPCVSAEGATRVNDALRGAVAIGRLSTKDNEASLLRIYDAVQIERTENVVRVHAELTGAQVDELLNRFVRR